MKKRKILVVLIILIAIIGARELVYHVSFPVMYRDYVVKYSQEYDIDPYLLLAVINVESRFDKNATSHKGAIGLMQLTESTAHWIAESMGNENFNTDDLYDPETNIRMGAWYIDNIRKEFGSTELVLAAYNAGRGSVAGWIDSEVIGRDGTDCQNIPYNETKRYVEKVMRNQDIYRILYDIS